MRNNTNSEFVGAAFETYGNHFEGFRGLKERDRGESLVTFAGLMTLVHLAIKKS